jgi:hypothetical protein
MDPAAQSLPIVAYSCMHLAKDSYRIGGISFFDKSIATSKLLGTIRSLFDNSNALNVLGVGMDGTTSHFEEMAPDFLAENIVLNAVESLEDVKKLVLSSRFDLVLADCSKYPAILFNNSNPVINANLLINALQTDSSLEALPILFSVAPFSQSLSHRHLGLQIPVSHNAACDYLAEQVAMLMIERGLGPMSVQAAA